METNNLKKNHQSSIIDVAKAADSCYLAFFDCPSAHLSEKRLGGDQRGALWKKMGKGKSVINEKNFCLSYTHPSLHPEEED